MASTTTPHDTTPLPLPHDCPVHGDWPQSPNALAAAVNLATLSDTRPSTAQVEDGHGHGEDDDDDSGGISLADYQQFMEATPNPVPLGEGSEEEEHEDGSVDIQTHDFLSQAHPAYAPYHAFEILDISSMPHHTSTAYFPPSPVFMTHLSNADPALEPPPSLHEPQLSIVDKTAFCPITSYFHHFFDPTKPLVPGLDLCQVPKFVDRHDLKGDRYDYQGIDWEARKTSRSAVREAREGFEQDRLPQCLKQVRKHIPPTANTDDFFQFKRISTTPRAFIPHFQLRNIITATSRNDIFFAQGHRVWRTDAEGTEADAIVDLSKHINPDASITTVASHDNVLIAGAFEGEYAITNLASTYGSPYTFGRTSDFATDTKSQIVNHMHLFASRRTYTPQAVLCSNDHRLRVLDCETNTFTHSFLYSAAVNCSATSPNGRMRVVVGDFQETLITNAETGQPFETLSSHTDDAFACAWADDGIHVATAAQDSTIVVWDARYWDKPLTVMKSELSVPRSLHFSPIGSGPRVLVAAEADDYINVINAQTWESKQVFDFFGPVGGVTFTPDGQSLFVSNGERRFGGVIELERTGWAEKTGRRKSWDHAVWDDVVTDWVHDDALHDHGGVLPGKMERRRRHVDLSDVVV